MRAQVKELWEKKCDDQKEIDLTGLIVDGYWIGTDGVAVSNGSCRSTDFVPVCGGLRLRLSGLKLAGRNAVCVYDGEKNYLRCIAGGSEKTEVEFRLPLKAAYVRASVLMDREPAACYVDLLDTKVETAYDSALEKVAEEHRWGETGFRTLWSQDPVIDISDKIVTGKFITMGGVETDSTTERCTDFVPVWGDFDVHFENVLIYHNRSVCAYDENKALLCVLKSNSEDRSFTLHMPEKAAYFRTCLHATEEATIRYENVVPAIARREARLALERIPVYNGEVETV